MKIPEAFKEKADKEEFVTIRFNKLVFKRDAFTLGAYWGYEQGVRDVVKALTCGECKYIELVDIAEWLSEHFGLSEEGGKDE